jgi:hypothetical protein
MDAFIADPQQSAPESSMGRGPTSSDENGPVAYCHEGMFREEIWHQLLELVLASS